MFRKLRQKMTRRVAPRSERTDVVRVRGLVERLEERAMLSASYGSMAHGYSGPDYGQPGGAASHFGASAAVASQQQMSMSYQTYMYSGGQESGGSYRELQNGPPMQMAFQPPPRTRSFEQHPLQNSAWNQSYASPPSPFGYSPYTEPDYYSYFEPEPVYVVSEYHIVSALPKVQEVQHLEATISNYDVAPHRPPPKPLPTGLLDSIVAGNRASAQNAYQSLPVSPDLVRETIPSGVGILGFNSTMADLPSVSQILSRETSTVATLSAVAREVAFQEFSPKLFQANATDAYDRANLNALGTGSTQPDMLDGFIRPTDESIAGEIVNSSDAVARERDAVDAVLEDLHDVDTLLPATDSTTLKFQIDLQTETALDEMPAGEVDGGMVLLQSTGDANGNGFDLTPVYANQLERFEAPAKMETTVGMFQAVDIVTDDAPINELVPQTESNTKLRPETKFDEKLPTRHERSSNKAAAVVGATTLTGALVWLSRSGRRFGRPEATAQKRRNSRY
jgi:hypothetical protein